MVPIVLFAIIGSVINPGVIYWVFFGLYCIWTFLKLCLIQENKIMPDIFVTWYDYYGCSHDSPVYFVDSVRDRFLVVDEDNDFYWVSTGDCQLLKQTKRQT